MSTFRLHYTIHSSVGSYASVWWCLASLSSLHTCPEKAARATASMESPLSSLPRAKLGCQLDPTHQILGSPETFLCSLFVFVAFICF